MAFDPGRFESEDLLQAIQKGGRRDFSDADGAVALHIRVTAQGRQPSARAANIASHQQQVGDLLYIGRAVTVLGDAHSVADDDIFGLGVDIGRGLDVGAGQPGHGFDGLPGRRLEILKQRLQADRVGGDEDPVEQPLAAGCEICGVGGDQRLHHALEHGDVAPDLELIIGRRDRGRAKRRHLDRILRRGEPLQTALPQRVEHDNRRAALRHLTQSAEHAWMVGAGVVSDGKDGVAVVEVFQRHRALADADGLRQADAGRFVTHVGAVGEIIGAVLAREQLIKKCRFVRRAAGGVELGHVRVGQVAQGGSDLGERLVPADRDVTVGPRVVDHRMGQTAFVLQVEVGPGPKFGNSVRAEELRRGAFGCRLP